MQRSTFRSLGPVRVPALALAAAASLLGARPAAAQSAPPSVAPLVPKAPRAAVPIRQIGPIEATSVDTIGFLYGVRELSDGRVLANDAGTRRLVLFDRSLAASTVVADSASGGRASYGRRPTGIIPFTGDSTIFIDLAARAFLVLDPAGRVARVISPPRPGDVGFMWNPALGTPRFDAMGRLVYRSWIMPVFKAPEAGKTFVPPEMPDSAPILRGDFDARRADTLAWVRIAKTRISTTYLSNGGIRLSQMVSPIAVVDDWTVLPDGTIAILRGHDYHLDWINPDGTLWSSPKMPFDWKRLTDEEKAAMVDSTKKLLEKALAAAGTNGAPGPGGGVGPHSASAVPSHSMTIMPAGAGDGPPSRSASVTATPGPQVPEVVPPGDLPDYVPPVFRSGMMKADLEGNVWILPSTSAQSGGGAGLLYDVVNRKGELFQRVRLPVGRALEGFGADGAVFLTVVGQNGRRLERTRIAH